MNYDIIVIGAGPAGLMAAIYASAKGRVLLIEHNDKLGRKILSTGNGKCNLTNMNMNKVFYRSSGKNADDYYRVIQQWGPNDLRAFFMSLGVLTIERDGYVYPASEQAQTIVNAFCNKIQNLPIEARTSESVQKIQKNNKGFKVITDKSTYFADKVILTTGGKAAAKLGSDGSGYDIAKGLGHSIIKPIPALVALKCKEPFLKKLSGVRKKADVSLLVGEDVIAKDYGEVQFTDYGLSGIVIFQLSRIAKRCLDDGFKPYILIDLMPEYSSNDIKELLIKSRQSNPNYDIKTILSGWFNTKIAEYLATLESDEKIISTIKAFRFNPYDTNDFDSAQVTAGGVDISEIDFATMESKLCTGLYFAGEIVDVDGICGGYNLTWAFASGRLAGICAGDSI